jgi:hypothetical protein
MTQPDKWRRRLDSLAFPAILTVWVICGVVLICQYKGMLPWLEQWPEAAIVLITFIPPLLLAMYAVSEILKLIVKMVASR